jgi:tape measure domain-containing protein
MKTATTFGVVSASMSLSLAAPVLLASEYEQATIKFETMLGSAQAARKMLDDLTEMAVRTPFETKDLEKNAVLLMGYGVTNQKLLPTLKAIGDVAGGNREKFDRLSLAYGQVTAKGRLMAQEVNQMTENGFNPLAEISRTTGVSVAELMKQMEDGAISADMLAHAFVTASSEGGRWNNLMEKQSKTFSGVTSTMRDYISLTMRDFGAPMIRILSEQAKRATVVLKAVREFIAAHPQLTGALAAILLYSAQAATALAAVGTGVYVASSAMLMFTGVAGRAISLLSMLSPLVTGLAKGVTSLWMAVRGLSMTALLRR